MKLNWQIYLVVYEGKGKLNFKVSYTGNYTWVQAVL